MGHLVQSTMIPHLPPPLPPLPSLPPHHLQHSPSPTPTPVPGQQLPVLPPSMLSTSSSSPSSSSTPCSTLFVANLELQHTEEEIRDIFRRYNRFLLTPFSLVCCLHILLYTVSLPRAVALDLLEPKFSPEGAPLWHLLSSRFELGLSLGTWLPVPYLLSLLLFNRVLSVPELPWKRFRGKAPGHILHSVLYHLSLPLLPPLFPPLFLSPSLLPSLSLFLPPLFFSGMFSLTLSEALAFGLSLPGREWERYMCVHAL